MKRKCAILKRIRKRRVTGETGMKYADPYTRVQDLCQDILQDEKRHWKEQKIFEYNRIRISSAVRDLLRITWCRKDGVVKCNRM